LGLQEGRDYERKCVGTAFDNMIDNLSRIEVPAGFPHCDVGVGAVTISDERVNAGIKFSEAIYHEKLQVMVKRTFQLGIRVQPVPWTFWPVALATILAFHFLLSFFFAFPCAARCVLELSHPYGMSCTDGVFCIP
jgi:hypothetical protein